eukprot:1601261-Prymnesium_polylepis.1
MVHPSLAKPHRTAHVRWHLAWQRIYPLALSARGAQRHGARNMRRETRDGRRSSIMHPPEPPDHAADTPRPTDPNLPYL